MERPVSLGPDPNSRFNDGLAAASACHRKSCAIADEPFHHDACRSSGCELKLEPDVVPVGGSSSDAEPSMSQASVNMANMPGEDPPALLTPPVQPVSVDANSGPAFKFTVGICAPRCELGAAP